MVHKSISTIRSHTPRVLILTCFSSHSSLVRDSLYRDSRLLRFKLSSSPSWFSSSPSEALRQDSRLLRLRHRNYKLSILLRLSNTILCNYLFLFRFNFHQECHCRYLQNRRIGLLFNHRHSNCLYVYRWYWNYTVSTYAFISNSFYCPPNVWWNAKVSHAWG